MNIFILVEGVERLKTSLGSSYERAFKQNECLTHTIDFDDNKNFIDKVFIKLFNRSFRREIICFKQIKKLTRNKPFDPNIIFILKGSFLNKYSLKYLKNKFPKSKIICFNPDDPFNTKSCTKNIPSNIYLYDHYFIWSKILQKKISQLNTNTSFLDFAYDPLYVRKSIKKKYDVVFIGNSDEHRNNFFQEVSRLFKIQGIKLHIFGNGWENIQNATTHRQEQGEKYFTILSSAIININLLRVQNKNALNMRSYEIPSCDSLMLHEKSDRLAEVFEDSKGFSFASPKELVNICLRLLEDPKRISSIKNKQLETIKYETYSKRVAQILSIIHE